MIFSIIVSLTNRLTTNLQYRSILYPPFLLGIMAGGSMIYCRRTPNNIGRRCSGAKHIYW
ncbi:MAG: hypothetical protein JWN34_4597 [Bryobacterales bacterium]|nr:hypothetical protein [Bryobacterales bacterium]